MNESIKFKAETVDHQLSKAVAIFNGKSLGTIEEAIAAVRVADQLSFDLLQSIKAAASSDAEQPTPAEASDSAGYYNTLLRRLKEAQVNLDGNRQYVLDGKMTTATLDQNGRITVRRGDILLFDCHPKSGVTVFVRGEWLYFIQSTLKAH